ncbi:MAG: methyl-accepting chemotaxis sensory transducer with Cache sensor [Clostridia bacterium]|jgi:methyl-accepting chemotaxis protein|nr:methyl-accepting chemotaxis sensory transducer with Cache sensor [Clostridia bacterium]
MKSIKGQLLIATELVILTIIIGLSSLALNISSKALTSTANTTMAAIVQQATKVVESRAHEQLKIVKMIAEKANISNSDVSIDYKLASLQGDVSRQKYIKVGIADLNGDIKFSNATSANVSDREYFKRALAGESVISDPLMSKAENKIVVVYAVPIKQDNKVIGVLTATKEGSEISSIVDDITFGNTGKAFMLANTGVKIAHYNNELVMNMDNDFENIKQDSNLKDLVALEEKMVKGEIGSGFYRYKGADKFLAFAPVPGTTWSLAVVVEEAEVFSELIFLKKAISIIALLFMLVSAAVVYFISNTLAKRIKTATHYIVPMGEGDFSQAIAPKHLNMKDEIGQMIQAVNTMQQSIGQMFSAVIENSNKIDLDAQSLSAVSEEMNSSSNAVTTSIQEVTKGATTQAEALTAITEGLNDFSDNLEHIIKDIQVVDESSNHIMKLSGESTEKVQHLAESVTDTNQLFKNFEANIIELDKNISKINEITNLINALSNQTNLLALNAAIEAARAGEAGRGFSVVADEIRKLAEQSKNSSENIAVLITAISSENELMIEKAQEVSREFANQTTVIDMTLLSFNEITSAIKQTIPQIGNINTAAENINTQKNNIVTQVENIAAISEQTAASSEEINASSEELSSASEEVASSAAQLSSRTEEMIVQVKRFKLDKINTL